MTDIAVNQAAMQNYNTTGKIIPTYLVVLEDGKKEVLFVATKFDAGFASFGKFVGFFVNNLKAEDIISASEETIKNTDNSQYVEIMFPWVRIKSIRSLIFKQKNK